MNWISRFFRKSKLERQLDTELRFHMEQQTAENIAAGMNPDEARRNALAQFGGLEYIKEETRDARGIHFLETLFQDVRFALCMLRKSPGFAAEIGRATVRVLFGVPDGIALSTKDSVSVTFSRC